jgi:hypothetical protein
VPQIDGRAHSRVSLDFDGLVIDPRVVCSGRAFGSLPGPSVLVAVERPEDLVADVLDHRFEVCERAAAYKHLLDALTEALRRRDHQAADELTVPVA